MKKNKRALKLVKHIKKCKSLSECSNECYELCEIAGYEYKCKYKYYSGNTWCQWYITIKAARALGLEICRW